MKTLKICLTVSLACLSASPLAAIREQPAPSAVADVWQPAPTPPGGVSWATLEATREITRNDAQGFIISRPQFTQAVRRLEGQRITVAGYMDAFEPGQQQRHFVLLGYPPGCPFHWHAAPNQFIEIKASTPFPLNTQRRIVVSGVLELTGEDESGIFYVLKNARPA